MERGVGIGKRVQIEKGVGRIGSMSEGKMKTDQKVNIPVRVVQDIVYGTLR